MIKDLNKSLEILSRTDDIIPFLKALKSFIDSEGTFSDVLKKTGLNKEQLQDILDDKTEIYFDDLVAILKALNCKITVQSIS